MTSPISINSRRETLSDKDFTTESGPIASKQSQSSRIAQRKIIKDLDKFVESTKRPHRLLDLEKIRAQKNGKGSKSPRMDS